MFSFIWGTVATINYKGNVVVLRIIKGAQQNNEWVEFGVMSDDETFAEVFGNKIIAVPIAPGETFDSAAMNLNKGTAEQEEVLRQIWNIVQKQYYK